MTHELPLSHIEDSVVAECARLINDCTYARPRKRFRLSGEMVAAIEEYIGPRLTRLALSKADFRPVYGDTEDWQSISPYNAGFHLVKDLVPEDFGIALDVLDVRGRLRAELGLTHA